MVSTDKVKELRDATGVSVMQCKKALEEAEGDEQQALEILKKKSKDIANKKSDREFGSGVVAAYVHGGGSVGAMVELLCETDFVSKNEEFKEMAYEIAMHAAAMNPMYVRKEDISEEDQAHAKALFEEEVANSGKPADIQEKMMEGKLTAHFGERTLLEQPFVKDPNITIQELIQQGIQKFGENVDVGRFSRFSVLDK